MNPNWDDLRVFLALAREGTLTTAARSLGVSHPTVSRRVAVLERQIGARLFERLPDRFVPTSAGEELLADTEAMEKAAHSIHRRSAGLSDTVSGTVRLSAGEAMAAFIARHLAELRDRLKQIEFEVAASHTLANLSRREADLLIREQVPELGDIVARKLGRVAYAIYAARDFPVGRPARVDPMATLADHPWLGFDDDHGYMPGQQWLLERLGGRRLGDRRPDGRVPAHPRPGDAQVERQQRHQQAVCRRAVHRALRAGPRTAAASDGQLEVLSPRPPCCCKSPTC